MTLKNLYETIEKNENYSIQIFMKEGQNNNLVAWIQTEEDFHDVNIKGLLLKKINKIKLIGINCCSVYLDK